MEVIDGRSSSNDLSSAPPSDGESTPARGYNPNLHPLVKGSGVAGNPADQQHTLVAPATSAGSRQASGDQQATAVAKNRVTKPRKKKDANATTEVAEKKERAPRRPRGASNAAGSVSSRKKPKLEQIDDNRTIHLAQPVNPGLQASTLVQPVAFLAHPETQHHDEAAKALAPNHHPNPSIPRANPISSHRPYEFHNDVNAPASLPPSRASAMYDPIRSMTISRLVDPTPSESPKLSHVHTPPRPILNPSTSPAISSIIDPPTQPTFASADPSANRVTLHTFASSHTDNVASTSPSMNNKPSAMEIDSAAIDPNPPKKAPSKKVPSEAPTRTTSPKPTRAKEQPPPPPPGSGLLSASLFGGDSALDVSNSGTGKAPNIVLHISLKDPENRIVNFARLAEQKYGFAALYPRQAAQKERLAKVAAAGAVLERSASGSKFGGTSAGESGDEDLSVDIDRDSDNDGDVAMSGVNGGPDAANSGTDGPGPKRRRRKKQEEYDQDDPFVDDSELLWEAHAAASKDGFFVYSGPLVPEGEKPAVERADGTIKRGRGRGRGGGPGSRGGRTAAAAAEGGSSRGGGPGSRGGGVTRKPRITKADRAQREQEKAAREKIAPLLARPTQQAA
ncbi:hypothetical protein B0A52_00873 [Exophiala mesophila]|uniref:Hpc2-related domain-containing protein n=1 Tax=Exophiala mesophila TaxID=212818 RepID=A0A438NIH4_EXOME|nr:hypothetical protein B0A52_00873 [Exophiala mesophila]